MKVTGQKENDPFLLQVEDHGIDIKANGGYIVAPPSNHASGGQYEIANSKPIIELPQIIIDLIGNVPNDHSVFDGDIPEGSRNTTK